MEQAREAPKKLNVFAWMRRFADLPIGAIAFEAGFTNQPYSTAVSATATAPAWEIRAGEGNPSRARRASHCGGQALDDLAQPNAPRDDPVAEDR
jgi:hypothetical protein